MDLATAIARTSLPSNVTLALDRGGNRLDIIGQTCRDPIFALGFSPVERQTGLWRFAYKCLRIVRIHAGLKGETFDKLIADRRVHLRDICRPTLAEAIAELLAVEEPVAKIAIYDIDHFRDERLDKAWSSR